MAEQNYMSNQKKLSIKYVDNTTDLSKLFSHENRVLKDHDH